MVIFWIECHFCISSHFILTPHLGLPLSNTSYLVIHNKNCQEAYPFLAYISYWTSGLIGNQSSWRVFPPRRSDYGARKCSRSTFSCMSRRPGMNFWLLVKICICIISFGYLSTKRHIYSYSLLCSLSCCWKFIVNSQSWLLCCIIILLDTSWFLLAGFCIGNIFFMNLS